MKLRTRVAVVVITVWVGCGFASPDRHSFSNSHAASDEPQTPPLTLQIQRTPSQTLGPKTELRNHRWPGEAVTRDDTDGPRPSYSTLPAGLDGHQRPRRTALKPVPVNHAPNALRPLKPVRLLDVWFRSIPVESRGERKLRPRAVDEKLHVLRPLNMAPGGRQQQNSISAHTRFDLPASKTWHRIVNGDTLPRLASTYCGDPQWWLLIYEANRDVLVSPEILPIGKELRIPDRSHTNSNARRSKSATTVPDTNTSLMSPIMPLTPRPQSDSGGFKMATATLTIQTELRGSSGTPGHTIP